MRRHVSAEQLSSYLDEQLGDREHRQMLEHLEECAPCRERLEGLRRVMSDLRHLREVSPPGGLGLRLQRRLVREAPPAGDRRGGLGYRFPRPLFQPALLASLGVVLALAFIMVLVSQVLGTRQGGFFVEEGGPSRLVQPDERIPIAGRTFEMMSGLWIEADLTLAEVTEARPVDRAELLDRSDLEPAMRQILGELEREVTLRWRGEVLRVSASYAER